MEKSKTKRSQWIILGTAVLLSAAMLITAIALRTTSEAAEPQPLYTITFCDASGTELAKQTVEENAFAIPPDAPQHGESEVFLGWGNPLYPVTADATCKPQFQDITSNENVFFTETVYIEKGKDATIPLKIGGQVALDRLELELHYNPRLLSFRSASSSLGETEAEDGKVMFTLAADKSLKDPATIAEVTFRAIGEAFTLGEFSFEVPVAQSNNSDATFARVKSQIYIYGKQ
jgi:hypothetical protein